jgi:phosphate transport system ATP-binding protein
LLRGFYQENTANLLSNEMNSDNCHINVENLNVFYGKTLALKNISLKIPSNKITVIIGPSGCGKTTLLKSFNRLFDLDPEVTYTGKIFVNNINILEHSVNIFDVRKKMGLLLQKPVILPMSIFDNVAYGLKIHGLREKKRLFSVVEHYLKEVNLWDEVKDRLHEPATRLSIGQQQRLCLARGLAIEPEIILGDEPTSALDPLSSRKIEERFIELKQKYSIVLVTHILRQAKRLADYVVFLYLGEVIEQAPAQEFFENPQKELTKEYIKGIIS